MSNRFYFDSREDTDSDLADNDDSLPFPKPLDRSAFLAPDFDPAVYLSSLSDRFQTLEDLQNELKELVQSLNRELVDLVNDNYQNFLSLGSTLSGGEEKVEEIRVGLMGFQRDIQGVRDKVDGRRNEVTKLLDQKKNLRREISKGRLLFELSDRLDDLEHNTGLTNPARSSDSPQLGNNTQQAWSEEWTGDAFDENDDAYDDATGVPQRLRQGIERYLILRMLSKKFDPQHPFLVAQRERMSRIYETIRFDLETAAKQEDDVKMKQKIIRLRATLDE